MRPVRVAFSKLSVLLIGQDEVVRGRVKRVLRSLGVSTDRICECEKRNMDKMPANDFDLVILDYEMERFSRDLMLNELNGLAEEDQSIPVVLLAEKSETAAIAHMLDNREHTVISPEFCPKSFYLKLNLLLERVRSSLIFGDERSISERISDDELVAISA